jgi:2-polyprenyl-3-methyl-5-hydroxy-6-metoxy-1,4-benzoquinol methylase
MHELIDPQCRICGRNAPAQPTGQFCNGYTLFCCRRCGTVIAAPRPNPLELKRLYDDFFDGNEYAAHRREFELIQSGKIPYSFRRQALLTRLERICKGRELIEIGGGTGAFGVLAKSRGWNYIDYDISDTAVRFARELSLDARTFDSGDVPPVPPQSADATVMWEVIEHVWNLREYMEVIRDALRPGGMLLFSTPNFLQARRRRSFTNNLGSSASASMDITGPPIHVNFFTKSSLERMLTACGFKPIDITTTRLYRPDSTVRSVLTFLRIVMFLESPHTLYGIAAKC